MSKYHMQVNNDPTVGNQLKLVLLENYGVTLAEEIIPCADLSQVLKQFNLKTLNFIFNRYLSKFFSLQHLTTPGSEASGTSIMKFMLNGALILATMDGARIEIAHEIGRDNMFVFGMDYEQVEALRKTKYNPMDLYNSNFELKLCLDQIRNGYFTPAAIDEFKDLVDNLLADDEHFVLADYADYMRAQELVAETFEVCNY